MSTGTFQRDLERFLKPPHPVALARFHDGEHHVLLGQPYDARSGWHVYRPSWLRDRLRDALAADLEDYWVGISPPCDYPRGTAYYRGIVRTKRLTFATLFWHSNYPRVRSFFAGKLAAPGVRSFATVGCSARCDYSVPANGVAKPWNLDELVTRLLQERRPILVAAGPSACVIVHEYWKRADPSTRQTILDIGAALDPILLGRNTRDFHKPGSPLLSHACRWDKAVPWSSAGGRKIKGYRARLAGLRTRWGGKQKTDK